ncbi:transcription initiation factor IID, 18kD subunit-domain-containing protein [Gloeopeniophorella convolvens]|nr:transcription initiation factor IID, 18kD subunit-domain-containing protein [Gloeopeniophorella convolvens]
MAYYPSQAGQHPAASGAYPYSTYSYTHPQTPGAYPYTAGAYPGTAVTGYGAAWPYPYSYYQHQPPSSLSKPIATPLPGTTATASTPTTTQRTTFTAYNPTYSRENAGAGASSGPSTRGYKKQSNFKGLFTKDLRNLMFGFGDDRNPSNDTVNVMEEILVEYIADICQTALAPTKKSRLAIEDFRRVLSRPADAKKLARMEELLFMQEDIKRARAQFNDSEMSQPKGLPS